MAKKNTKKMPNNRNESTLEKYKYVFEGLSKEQEEIITNGRSIDTKAGLFLTLSFATLPFYIQTLDVNFIKEICAFNSPTIPKSFFFFFFILSMIAYSITFCFFMLALFPRDFKRLSYKPEELSNLYFIEHKYTESDLTEKYRDAIYVLSKCILFSEKRGHKKSKWFKRSLIAFITYSALILLVIFLKLFLVF
ncbi:MAG: hypothetical protein MJ213_05765 [Bacilli bacterium]|nr:hypothetical protein [Bacilli bacterium]